MFGLIPKTRVDVYLRVAIQGESHEAGYTAGSDLFRLHFTADPHVASAELDKLGDPNGMLVFPQYGQTVRRVPVRSIAYIDESSTEVGIPRVEVWQSPDGDRVYLVDPDAHDAYLVPDSHLNQRTDNLHQDAAAWWADDWTPADDGWGEVPKDGLQHVATLAAGNPVSLVLTDGDAPLEDCVLAGDNARRYIGNAMNLALEDAARRSL